MSETTFDEPASTTHPCGKAWGGLRSLGARGISTFNTWRKRMDQNSLERALAQIIETANGHRAKGLPKGSPAYFVLRDKADAKIQAFARKWDVDIGTIEAQAPALADLDSLCIPDKQVPAGLKLLAALLGTILSLLLLGAASGLVNASHDWVIRLVVR
ncbi:MAG: hypothetical protein WBE41_08135 [Terracidiphilus sp.]